MNNATGANEQIHQDDLGVHGQRKDFKEYASRILWRRQIPGDRRVRRFRLRDLNLLWLARWKRFGGQVRRPEKTQRSPRNRAQPILR